jgi:hypothetical protein
MTAPSSRPAQSKPLFERVVETLATGLGESVAWLAERGVLFGLYVVVWAAFISAMVVSPRVLDDAWQYIGQALPLPIQLVIWALFLPVMAGLWVWDTTWPLLVRVPVVLGLAAFTLLVMRPSSLRLPRRTRTADDSSE